MISLTNDEYRFDPLSNDRNVRFSSNSSKETNFSIKTLCALELISINIISIRGKTMDLLAFLEVLQPHLVAIRKTKINSSIATSGLFLKHVITKYSERTDIFMLAM